MMIQTIAMGEGNMQKVKQRTMIESGKVVFLPVRAIRPNPGQPRKVFDRDAMQELAGSIAQYGILQPISVRRSGGGFELIAGERRLRAAKIVGLDEVPCIVMTLDEEQSGMVALVENLQRRDLDYIEEAEGLSRLMRLYGLSQEQAARRIGKSQSAVANKLRLLQHTPAVLEALRTHGLSERHARALLRLPGEPERLAAIGVIVRKGLTVAKTEEYIEGLLAARPPKPFAARKLLLKDVRLFLNTVNHNLEIMRNAGIRADCGREETEDEIVLTIRLPKRTGEPVAETRGLTSEKTVV